MKNYIVIHIISLLMIAVLACGWYGSCARNSQSSVSPPAPDTCIIEKIIYDTIFQDTIIYKDKIVKDTFYIETDGDDVISLPIVQKHYNSPNIYDIWISGIEPLDLDSIKVYQKTSLQTETIYQDKIVYKEKEERLSLYLGGGFYSFSDVFIPEVGVSLGIKQKWLISANIGLDKQIYNIDIKYKLF